MDYQGVFNENIGAMIKLGVGIMREHPKSALSLGRIAAGMGKAEKKRRAWEKEGVQVPPLLIVSMTDRCNLSCVGCYAAQANNSLEKREMTPQQVDTLLSEAHEAGCVAILLAGGEPLLCEQWLEGMEKHSEFLSLMFTNGTLIDADRVDWFHANRHIIPLISIEGDGEDTDARRGSGVHEGIEEAMARLQGKGIPFGISITTGEHNIEKVTTPEFTQKYRDMGCKLIVHVEYVPVDETEIMHALSLESKEYLAGYCEKATGNDAAYIVFPGDESIYDGCLAAGRGFAHISASGSLEPCPFAPYSDRNVCEASLIEALRSPLLSAIRRDSEKLHEGVGGCALRQQGAYMDEILKQSS